MSNFSFSDAIHVKDLNLWAHVGVLEKERLHGQPFLLDFSIWLDLELASSDDAISKTADYSLAIMKIQELSFKINCFTIEHFSEQIIALLEHCYGPLPMRVLLKKCIPPINGFSGSVSIEKKRNFPIINS